MGKLQTREESLKKQLSTARRKVIQYKLREVQLVKELEKMGVFVPTAGDPLCERGNRNGS